VPDLIFLSPTPSSGDFFGRGFSLEGNNLIIGEPFDDLAGGDVGVAYLYDISTCDAADGTVDNVCNQPDLTFENPTPIFSSRFGNTSFIDGNNVLFGLRSDPEFTFSGGAHLFDITTCDAADGTVDSTCNVAVHSFLNPTPDDNDGFATASVSVSGNFLLMGAEGDDTNESFSGAAYLFDTNSGALITSFLNPDVAVGDSFGEAVSMSGNTAVIHSRGMNTVAADSGVVYVFDLSPLSAKTWVGGATGDWSNTANWSGGVLPSGDDTITIDGGITVTLDIPFTLTTGTLTIQSGSELVIGAGVTLTNESTNTITINGLVTNTSTLINSATGTIIITATGTLTNTGSILNFGIITNNGIFNNTGAGVIINKCGGIINGTVTGTQPVDVCVNGMIAFASTRDEAGNLDIYVMNSDGTGPQPNITNEPLTDTNPSWSPDGTKIAFSSIRVGFQNDIYVMNADGSGLNRLTTDPASDFTPTWSPDGKKIAFTSNRDAPGFAQIFVMNADGSVQNNISNFAAGDSNPGWSPDGTKIAFDSFRDGPNRQIYVMNSDGSGATSISLNPSNDDRFPRWSPDGTQITFYTDRDGNTEVYVMNADGSGQTNLSNNPESDLLPDWSPDGTKITFSSGRVIASPTQIFVMDADGSNPVNLSNNPSGGDNYSRWGIAPDNIPPVANPDSFRALKNNPVTIDPTANDSDADLDPLTISNFDVSSVQGGTITSGSLIYTPATDFVSPPNDTFDYTISDGNGGFDTNTVTMEVVSFPDVTGFAEPIMMNDGLVDTALYRTDVSGNNIYMTWTNGVIGDKPVAFRASNDGGNSFGSILDLGGVITNSFGESKVVSSGNNVYVAWANGAIGSRDISLRVSGDNGASFGSEINLSDNGGVSGDEVPVELAADGNNLYAVWRDGTNQGILFRHSTDNGLTFNPPIGTPAIDLNINAGIFPSLPAIVEAVGGNVYVAWPSGSNEILFRASTDGGVTFNPPLTSAPTNLSNNAGSSFQVVMAVAGSNVYIGWVDNTPGNNEIFFRASNDNGVTFNPPLASPPENLSNTVALSQSIDMVALGNNLYIGWTDSLEVSFRTSLDGGVSFVPPLAGPAVTLSQPFVQSVNPKIAAELTNVFVTWKERSGVDEVSIIASQDEGLTFESEINISNSGFADSFTPDYLHASGGQVHLFWADNILTQTTAGTSIFYRTGTPINQSPVANDDFYKSNNDVTLDVPLPADGVLDNDTDVDPLTAILVMTADTGTLNFLNSDGTFNWTPPTNTLDQYSAFFTYQADDGNSLSNIATATIDVFRPQLEYIADAVITIEDARFLRVTDPVANQDPLLVETIDVSLSSTLSPGFIVLLTEDSTDSTTFTSGTIKFTTDPTDEFAVPPQLNVETVIDSASFTYKGETASAEVRPATGSIPDATIIDPLRLDNDVYLPEEAGTTRVLALAADTDPLTRQKVFVHVKSSSYPQGILYKLFEEEINDGLFSNRQSTILLSCV